MAIITGRGGFPEVVLKNSHGTARISALGATVLSWIPNGQEDILWVSPRATFQLGSAIRGGVPVCWPWFASDPAHPDGPSHGLVRTRRWAVERHADSEASFAISHHESSVFPAFRLTLEVRLGVALKLSLTHHNLSDDEVGCTGALHAYFAADASRATVSGLGSGTAFDKILQREREIDDPLRCQGPIDLVIESGELAILQTPGRRLALHRHDAPDVVQWNPGAERPADVPVGGEAQFVCLEAAAVTRPWKVPGGGRRTLGMTVMAR